MGALPCAEAGDLGVQTRKPPASAQWLACRSQELLRGFYGVIGPRGFHKVPGPFSWGLWGVLRNLSSFQGLSGIFQLHVEYLEISGSLQGCSSSFHRVLGSLRGHISRSQRVPGDSREFQGNSGCLRGNRTSFGACKVISGELHSGYTNHAQICIFYSQLVT